MNEIKREIVSKVNSTLGLIPVVSIGSERNYTAYAVR